MGLFDRIRRLVTPDTSWREVHRTVPHPVYGELHFVGTRLRPDDPIGGLWKVTYPPAIVPHPITVDFPSADDPPTAEVTAPLDELVRDLDGLFERCRAAVAPEYEHWVGQPLPADWRAAFRLDGFRLPDLEEAEPTLEVSYWCEGAQHWFNVEIRGTTVIGVYVEG